MRIFGLYILKPSMLEVLIKKAKKDVLRVPNAMISILLKKLHAKNG